MSSGYTIYTELKKGSGKRFDSWCSDYMNAISCAAKIRDQYYRVIVYEGNTIICTLFNPERRCCT